MREGGREGGRERGRGEGMGGKGGWEERGRRTLGSKCNCQAALDEMLVPN